MYEVKGVFGRVFFQASAPPTNRIVETLFIRAVFLSPVVMNWEPGEATIRGSSGTVATEQEPEGALPTVTLVKVLVLPELPNCRNNISQHFQHAKNGPSPISFITVRAGPERSRLVHGTVTRIALLRPLHSRVSAIIAPRRCRYLSYARSLPQSRVYALR